MRAVAAALCLALLGAGCATEAPPDPAQAQCEQEADNDPQVKELANRALASAQLMVDLRPDIKYARKQAIVACLRRKGIGPKGGVEPLRP